jgi:hypothetical protein
MKAIKDSAKIFSKDGGYVSIKLDEARTISNETTLLTFIRQFVVGGMPGEVLVTSDKIEAKTDARTVGWHRI